MGFTPSNGTKLYVGPVADINVDTASEYAGLTYVEVKGVTNLGEFGDSSADITSSELNDNRVQHAKGTRDGGSPAFVCNNYPDDAGQQAMYAAESDNNDYAFKIVFPNPKTTGGVGATRYFRGRVMSTREGVGAANSPINVTFNVGINSDVVRVAAT